VGAILSSIALVLMPNSSSLWMAAGLLWLLDTSANISMEPFRAFVGDLLPPNQRTKGFAMQSLFIGLGSVIASILPWVLTRTLQLGRAHQLRGNSPDGEDFLLCWGLSLPGHRAVDGAHYGRNPA
jgi:MFS family permease